MPNSARLARSTRLQSVAERRNPPAKAWPPAWLCCRTSPKRSPTIFFFFSNRASLHRLVRVLADYIVRQELCRPRFGNYSPWPPNTWISDEISSLPAHFTATDGINQRPPCSESGAIRHSEGALRCALVGRTYSHGRRSEVTPHIRQVHV